MKMPEKDPNFITAIGDALMTIQVFLYAALVAMVRILRDEKEQKWKRIILEMVLCGLLAQGIESGARYFFEWDIPTLIAAAVGLLGPEWVRMKINKAASKKIDDHTPGGSSN